MIKNEHQFKITSKLARELRDDILSLPTHKEYLKLEPLAQKAVTSSMLRQLHQYECELAEYESLKAGKFDFGEAEKLMVAAEMLIKMRLATGITQEELAEKLRLKKQQIQLYESTNYESASLKRVKEVAEVLYKTGTAAQQSRKSSDRGTSATKPAKKTTKTARTIPAKPATKSSKASRTARPKKRSK